MKEAKKIILFDGVCNMCNSTINFIIKHDKNDIFRYASLQSDIGKQLIQKRNIDSSKLDSILLIEPKKSYYYKSTAALHIIRHLSGLYPIFSVFLIIPSFFRDWVYDIIAKNRYKWFGKKESCMIPTPELRSLFIDQH
ncbi:DCC1-like thiol-disulfide oxidoreductase family protein [Aquimarina sp. 2201CG1-2-11]|uniref:thiol-disulfide oxidoreductase DCC family protein n=1 Tax=Aquimarina discodermiae TaxID=3231043 RepID=UPI003462A000